MDDDFPLPRGIVDRGNEGVGATPLTCGRVASPLTPPARRVDNLDPQWNGPGQIRPGNAGHADG